MSRNLENSREKIRQSRTGPSIFRRGSAAAFLLAVLIVFCPGRAHAGPVVIPIPNITGVSPASVPAGNSFTLTVYGSNFLEKSVVNWNGTPLATTYVSRHKLTAAVPNGTVQSAGSGWVTVLNAGAPVSNLAFVNVTVSTTAVDFVQTDIPVTGLGSAVALGDFTGSGILDIVTGAKDGTTISVLLGNGDGTFQPAITSPSPQGMDGISVADFNGDGKLDVAIVSGNTGSISILLGDGTGHFTTPHTYTFPTSGTSAYTTAVGDFNDDGKLDVAVALFGGAGDVLVYLGVGDGTLLTPTSYSVDANALYGIVAADFNGDGQIDLAVSAVYGKTATILLGNGNGTFTPQTPIPLGGDFALQGLAQGDFNQDGNADLAVMSQNGSPYILLGNGNGTFATPVSYPSSLPTSFALAVGDLNGDGNPDLAVVGVDPSAAAVLLGSETGTFAIANLFGTGAYSTNVAMGDLDHSGRQGLVVTDFGSGVLHVLGQDTVLTPSTLTFSSQANGTTSASQTFTLTNAAPSPVVLSGISFSGGNSGDFGFAAGGTCTGMTLTLCASCTIQVAFTPSVTGAETSTLFVFDSDMNSFTAIVNGTGTAPVGPIATFAPTGLIFPTQAQGTMSVEQSVTLTNTGTASMTGIVVTVTGTNSADFLEEDSCNVPHLAANASCTIYAAFKPSIVGAESASLSVADNAAGSPQTVLLSGTGAQFIPVITWATPAAIAYGTALSATQLNAASRVAGTFVYTPAAGTVLTAGSQPLSVAFTPTDTTTYTNATGNVTLTVTKAAPTVTWVTPAAITYGTALSAAQLDATASVPGSFVYSPPLGVVLSAGSQPLSVTFTPTDAIDYTTATASVTLSVSGTATTDVLATSASSANPGASITFTDTVSSASGVPAGSVSFLDGATSLATVTLSGGVAAFTTSALAAGTHTITAVYAGAGNFMGSTSAAITEIIGTPTFIVAPVPGAGATPVMVAPGQSAKFELTVAGVNGFTGMTTFSVAGLPSGATGAFSPPTITLGATPATETLTVTTTPQFPYVSAYLLPIRLGSVRPTYLFAAAIFAFAGLVFAGFGPLKFRRGNWALRFALVALFAVAAVLGGCTKSGNFQNTGTPAGTYPMVVTATSGTVQHATTMTLIVQ